MNRNEIRGGLDTSVLIRLLTGQPEPLADLAFGFLADVEEARAGVFVSNLVISEVYYACQHHYAMSKADVLHGLFELLSRPTFIVQPALLTLLSGDNVAKAKPGFVDRLIHSEYAATGLTLVTFEKSATRLAGVRVLKPTKDDSE